MTMSAQFNRLAAQRDAAIAGNDFEALRRIAQALIDRAKQGDMVAIEEIADTLDGPALVQTE